MGDQLLKACDLYAKTCRGAGQREYLVGYQGNVKVLIFKVHDPQPDGPTHTMFYAERKPRHERPARDAERGRASYEAVSERADAASERVLGSKSDRDEHAAELAERFEPDSEIPF